MFSETVIPAGHDKRNAIQIHLKFVAFASTEQVTSYPRNGCITDVACCGRTDILCFFSTPPARVRTGRIGTRTPHELTPNQPSLSIRQLRTMLQSLRRLSQHGSAFASLGCACTIAGAAAAVVSLAHPCKASTLCLGCILCAKDIFHILRFNVGLC